MNEWPALERFLRTDPLDVGCAEAMELLHVCVELVAADGLAAAAQRHPASRRICGLADHAARTSTGCSQRCAAWLNDQSRTRQHKA